MSPRSVGTTFAAFLLGAAAGGAIGAHSQAFTSGLTTAISQDALDAAAAANLVKMQATTPQFVANSAYLARADLMAQFPCGTVTLGKLAHVSDLYGAVSGSLVCENIGGAFYWRPLSAEYAANITATSGTVTLTPLDTAPIINLPNTPTGNLTIALSTTNAWPGATFHIYAPATIGVNGVSIAGLVGGGTLPLVQGSDKVVTFTASGWR